MKEKKFIIQIPVFIHENVTLKILYSKNLGFYLARETNQTSSDLSVADIDTKRVDVVSDYFRTFEEVIFAMQDYLKEWSDAPETVELFSLPQSYAKIPIEEYKNGR